VARLQWCFHGLSMIPGEGGRVIPESKALDTEDLKPVGASIFRGSGHPREDAYALSGGRV